ncbi:hypothetical protein DNTS_011730, partial [Danionella cerebrum]
RRLIIKLPFKLWSRLELPLCARSSLCSVSTQCWRSSPCTDDSLQLSPSFGGFRVGVRLRSPSGSFSQSGTLLLGHVQYRSWDLEVVGY